jgi:antibiotic biosynthesis monooxygenase (ABM) superfamily enzyme
MTQSAEVVSVIRHQVRPGHQADYEAWTRQVVPIAQQFEGHHGVAIIRPSDGEHTYTVVLHFDTLDHLRAWLESDVRRRLLAQAEAHLAQPGDIEIRPGLDFWLSMPGQRRAKPHRQFLVALSVIFPLSLVVPVVMQPLFASMPDGVAAPLVRSFVGSAVIVGLMTYVIMPRYTKRVASWLYGER